MSVLGVYQKEIKGHMEKTEKDFKAFIKVMLENKPEPYMELGSVQVFEDMMITSNAINKLQLEKLELDIKLKDKDPRKDEKNNANKRAEKMMQNNKCEKNGAASTSPKEEQGASAIVAPEEVKMADATNKTKENPITEKSEEQGAAVCSDNLDVDTKKMIIEFFNLDKYHTEILKQWSGQMRDMIMKGGRIKWVPAQKKIWKQFEDFNATALERLLE